MSKARSLSGARAREAAPLFSALGDATRLTLLASLCAHGPMTVTRLAAAFRVTRQALTKHLDVLEGAGFVESARRGRERLWRLAPGRLADVQGVLADLSRQWDDALGRLQAFVEPGDGLRP